MLYMSESIRPLTSIVSYRNEVKAETTNIVGTVLRN